MLLTILAIIVAAILLTVATAGEFGSQRRWHRAVHATLGATAILVSCGLACVTTAAASEKTELTPAAKEESTADTTVVDERPAASAGSPITDEDASAANPASETATAARTTKSAAADEPTIYTGPVYPADRPTWVTEPNVTRGDTHTVVVDSGPCYSRQECLAALDAALKKSVDAYVDEYLNVNGAASHVNLSLNQIRTELVDPERHYAGTVEFSFGPMREEYRQLRFTREFREGLDDRWREVVARNRLLKTGLGAGGVLMMLAVVCGYFKVDTATRGYYSGRLQFGAAAAILTLVIAGAVVAGWIPRL
ncbi:MAG: hypothetical protein KDA71_25365 [Planctomycetales bacterium]|nr:hypothetical protein [Planctomycetales bacterium]